MPSTHVSVRLSHGAWTRYSAEAEAHGLALGTYLRRRLEQQDQFLENELALRAKVTRPAAEDPGGENYSVLVGLLVEMLFILRQIVSPQKSAIAHSEVKRLGASRRGKHRSDRSEAGGAGVVLSHKVLTRQDVGRAASYYEDGADDTTPTKARRPSGKGWAPLRSGSSAPSTRSAFVSSSPGG